MPYDVFFSYNSKNERCAVQLAEALRRRGLNVWLDQWEHLPGRRFQTALEEAIRTAKSAAVLVGKQGLSPYQTMETQACLNENMKRQLPVIPVLLPGARNKPTLTLFLESHTYVDLRRGISDEGLDRLQWAITGKPPGPRAPSASGPRSDKPIVWTLLAILVIIITVMLGRLGPDAVLAGFTSTAIAVVCVFILLRRVSRIPDPEREIHLRLFESLQRGWRPDVEDDVRQLLDKQLTLDLARSIVRNEYELRQSLSSILP